MSGRIEASGNIQFIHESTGTSRDISQYSYCYYYMFSDCTSLTKAPELPATKLADNCYRYMFYKCSSLTQAPALPATTLAGSCYR